MVKVDRRYLIILLVLAVLAFFPLAEPSSCRLDINHIALDILPAAALEQLLNIGLKFKPLTDIRVHILNCAEITYKSTL